MSKVFSIIGLETNTGIRDVGLMSGIPEVEDIQKSQLYKELVEDCGESEFITVAVKCSVMVTASRRTPLPRISTGSSPILSF